VPLYRDEAVVLRTYKLGEADRIVVLFGRSKGKIRAVAKGVRKTKSKFGSKLEPGSIIKAQFYEGKNLDIVTQAERSRSLPLLRTDLERYGRVSILLESVDQTTDDNDPNPAMFKLLTGALTELERTGNALVVPAFVARLLALEGVQPMVDSCVSCGAESNLVSIELREGGVLCGSCRRGPSISDGARQALSHILHGRVRYVLDNTPPLVQNELEALAARMVEQHTERRLRSSAVIYQQMQG